MNHPAAAAAANSFFDDYDETLRTAWRGVAWRWRERSSRRRSAVYSRDVIQHVIINLYNNTE